MNSATARIPSNTEDFSINEIMEITRLSRRRSYELVKGRRLKVVGDETSSSYKGFIYEKIIAEKLSQAGFECELMPNHCAYDIRINSTILADVKGASKTIYPKSASQAFYNFNLRYSEKGDYCDIFFLYIEPLDDFYCIPSDVLKGRETCRINHPKTYKGQIFEKYQNNFDAINFLIGDTRRLSIR